MGLETLMYQQGKKGNSQLLLVMLICYILRSGEQQLSISISHQDHGNTCKVPHLVMYNTKGLKAKTSGDIGTE